MRNVRLKSRRDWKRITGWILFISLLFSIAYAIVKIAVSPVEPTDLETYEKVKSDYFLMLIQCLLGIFVMFIPSAVEHRLSVDIPNKMEV